MECYKVIDKEYELLNYDETKKKRIKEIITEEFSGKIKETGFFFKPSDNKPVETYLEKISSMDNSTIVTRFIHATMTNDGEKNKSIKDSILYILREENSFTILRLEAKDDIGVDDADFVKVSVLENYKLCHVTTRDFPKIIVLDSNIKSADYWTKKFLDLEEELTSKIMTEEFLAIIEKVNENHQRRIIGAIIDACKSGENRIKVLDFMNGVIFGEDYLRFQEAYFGRHEDVTFEISLLEEQLKKSSLRYVTPKVGVKRPNESKGEKGTVLFDDGNDSYLAIHISGNYLEENKSEFSRLDRKVINYENE